MNLWITCMLFLPMFKYCTRNFLFMVSVDEILQTLSTVIDPDLKKAYVSMGMIKDLEINGNDLKFTLELTTPACPFNDEIEQDVRKPYRYRFKVYQNQNQSYCQSHGRTCPQHGSRCYQLLKIS